MTFSGLSLSEYINGGAEVYHAYGFREAAVREYQDAAGNRLAIEIYRMDCPENAFGVFSTDSSGATWPIGADSSYGDGLLRFWKGPYFVRIFSYPASPAVERDIRELGARIADAISLESKRPDMLQLIPKSGVAADSVCYFHRQTSLNNIHFLGDENLLNLGDDVDALTWWQELADGRVRLLVARYPTREAAAGANKNFIRKYLEPAGPPQPGAPVTGGIGGSFAGALLQGKYLLLIFEAGSAGSATRILDETKQSLSLFEEGGEAHE